MILAVLITTGAIFAQTSPQSRLNVGKDVKRTLTPGNPPGSSIFGTMPVKLNFSSKNEFTQYYRNLLLNTSSSVKVAEAGVVDSKKPQAFKAVDQYHDKIKFGSIYPNPAVSFADVPYESLDAFKDARITVMNMVGTSLLEYPVNPAGSKVRINTTDLDSGIYMVQFVVDGKKVGTKKLLVERN